MIDDFAGQDISQTPRTPPFGRNSSVLRGRRAGRKSSRMIRGARVQNASSRRRFSKMSEGILKFRGTLWIEPENDLCALLPVASRPPAGLPQCRHVQNRPRTKFHMPSRQIQHFSRPRSERALTPRHQPRANHRTLLGVSGRIPPE